MSKKYIEEECIEIVKKFIDNTFSEELSIDKKIDLFFEYCFIRDGYGSNWENIKKSGEYIQGNIKVNMKDIIDKYNEKYGDKDLTRDSMYSSNRSDGDGDNTRIVYAVYYLLWKDSGLFENEKYKKLDNIFGNHKDFSGETLNTRDTLCRKDNKWLIDKIGQDKKIIEKAEKFRWDYETLGNFMPFPVILGYNLNNSKNINFQDQFDLFLKAIKHFYKLNKEALKKDENLEYDNEDNFSNVLVKNREYFKIFGNFKTYIEKNYMQDYIKNYNQKMTDEEMEVIDLFNRKNKEKKQISEYFDNLLIDEKSKYLNLIKKRADRMKKELKEVLI